MSDLLDALNRQAGLTGRYLASGALALPATLANPLAWAANQGLGAIGSDYRFPDQYEALQQAMTEAGLPQPQSGPEKVAGFFAEMGVPDPSDVPKVAAGVSHMIDPNQFGDLIQAMTVFHGSPHKWNKPDLSKVGTGEGAQAYGHGFYVAENPEVAGVYRHVGADPWQGRIPKMLVDNFVRDAGGDKVKALEMMNRRLVQMEKSDINGRQGLTDAINNFDAITNGSIGNLYELDLPDETIAKMLDWDKPLSEQPEVVKQLNLQVVDDSTGMTPRFTLEADITVDGRRYRYDIAPTFRSRKDAEAAVNSLTGADVYNRLSGIQGETLKGGEGSREASRWLNSIGIPGIKYLDGTSRSAGDGTRNFVIFDEQYITPLTRNGEPISRN